jgi:hypothetical protein
MEPLYYVLAIMGCGDAGMACQEQRVEPVRYRTMAQCQAAMLPVLERSTDIAFPVVQGACQRRGIEMASREKPRG